MNVINKFLLWLVLIPKAIYERMDVNVHQLKAILRTKLITDDRTPSSFQQVRGYNKAKWQGGKSFMAAFMSVLMGIGILAFSILYTQTSMAMLTFYFTFFIILFALFLVTDFTSVLIDVRDNYIILPKPVNDKTVVVARLLYILIYLTKIALPMLLPCIIYIAMTQGVWGTCVFTLLAAMATVFVIFLVNMVYLFILKITTPQKFQSIISYIQVIFTIGLYASYRMLAVAKGPHSMLRNIHPGMWMWFAPSYWFAGSWKFFTFFILDPNLIERTALSLLMPPLGLWLVVKYLAPSFNRKLAMIGNSEMHETSDIKGVKGTVKTKYSSRLAAWFTKQGAEKMAFLFVWKMTGRSREYRLKVLPAIGYMFVLVVVMIYQNVNKINLSNVANESHRIRIILLGALYVCSYFLIIALAQLAYSEKYKASWIYHTTPVKIPGPILSGALKSLWAKFFLPFIIIISVGSVTFFGVDVIPNLLFGIINQLFISSIIVLFTVNFLPFSGEQLGRQSGSRQVRNMGLFVLLGILCVIHYFIYSYWWAVCILGVLSLIGTLMIMKGIRETTWEELYGEKNRGRATLPSGKL